MSKRCDRTILSLVDHQRAFCCSGYPSYYIHAKEDPRFDELSIKCSPLYFVLASTELNSCSIYPAVTSCRARKYCQHVSQPASKTLGLVGYVEIHTPAALLLPKQLIIFVHRIPGFMAPYGSGNSPRRDELFWVNRWSDFRRNYRPLKAKWSTLV